MIRKNDFRARAAVILVLSMHSIGASGVENIGALGRIEPAGGVVNLIGASGDTIVEIAVSEGDVVEKGAMLATFKSYALRSTEFELAELAVREAKEVGKMAISLQDLNVRKAREDLDYAQKNLDRFRKMGGAETLSEQQKEEREHLVNIGQIQVRAAEEELARLKRDLEIKLENAEKQLKIAEERMAASVLRAPIGGTILEILKNPGETMGAEPFILMANLKKMYVIGEIYESDLLKLSPGLAATVTSNSFPFRLKGKVESVGRIIAERSKVAKAAILLDKSETASKLINMEVSISISL